MEKGVNRQVLEIHETGSDYFEKAMFFVKPEYSTLGEKKLTASAAQLLKNPCCVPKSRREKQKNGLLLAAKLISAAGIGAALTALIK